MHLECRRQAGRGVLRTVRKGNASFSLKGMGGQVGSVGRGSGLLLAGESSSKWNYYRRPAGVQLWVAAAGQPLPSCHLLGSPDLPVRWAPACRG